MDSLYHPSVGNLLQLVGVWGGHQAVKGGAGDAQVPAAVSPMRILGLLDLLQVSVILRLALPLIVLMVADGADGLNTTILVEVELGRVGDGEGLTPVVMKIALDDGAPSFLVIIGFPEGDGEGLAG